MKFKITSVRQDSTVLTHYYDNITQQITTGDGVNVYLAQDPRCRLMVKGYHIKKQNILEYKQKQVSHLRIQIGLSCNYHCTYCNQSADRLATKQVRMPDEVQVRNFIKLLKSNGIVTNRITLWGGEPFVYWKLIQKLVPALEELYPDAVISTVTNGSLIDKEKMDFIINHKMKLTVSHDAHAFSVYRSDSNPLDNEEILNQLRRLHHVQKSSTGYRTASLCMNVVITPDNCDLLNIDKYFTQKFGFPVRWKFESMVKCDRTNAHLIHKFTQEKVKTFLSHIMIAGTSDPTSQFWSVRKDVSELLGYLINQVDAHNLPYSCDINDADILACDLNGNIIDCHGSNPATHTIGNINNIEQAHNSNNCVTWMARDNCKTCPVLISCRSACCIVPNEDTNVMCDNIKLYYLGIFSCAWKILFNSLIQTIEAVE